MKPLANIRERNGINKAIFNATGAPKSGKGSENKEIRDGRQDKDYSPGSEKESISALGCMNNRTNIGDDSDSLNQPSLIARGNDFGRQLTSEKTLQP